MSAQLQFYWNGKRHTASFRMLAVLSPLCVAVENLDPPLTGVDWLIFILHKTAPVRCLCSHDSVPLELQQVVQQAVWLAIGQANPGQL